MEGKTGPQVQATDGCCALGDYSVEGGVGELSGWMAWASYLILTKSPRSNGLCLKRVKFYMEVKELVKSGHQKCGD